MTNYNERLDKILEDHREWMRGIRTDRLVGTSSEVTKQAITSLIKELVADAKPSKKHVGDEVAENRSYTGERLFNATIDEFEQNLLKALEDK